MSSLKHSRSTPVPILLNEFPAPPTFIPHNISNPPPSRPPSLPLPPLPGPSPLSDHDLFQITAATRSRRASRISTSSNSSSWRDSSASFASVGSGPSSLAVTASTAMTAQPLARNPTEPASSTLTHSLRSHSTYARAANADNHRPPPTMNPAIMEDDESLSVDPVDPSLTRTSLADIPRIASPNPYEPTLHGERLSSIDMRDLPAMQDDDLDTQAHSFHMQTHRAQPTSRTLKSHQVMPQPQTGNPTGGETHMRASSAIQHSQNKGSFHDAGHASTSFPGRPLPDERDRASSPDIASIIAATPRPRRRSETSSGSRSRSHSRRRAPKSLPGSRRTSAAAAAAGRLSIFSLPDEHVRQGSISSASRSLLPYANNADDGDGLWNEDSLIDDYGVVVGGDDGAFANVPDEDDIAGESDSSLDLHTPLPSLMLRDGLLSPHSKLLPHNVGCDSPVVTTHPNRHGSVVSNSMTKSGVFKDERDTIRRRVRHRDGRLLRGGIGLTTGLGWSDRYADAIFVVRHPLTVFFHCLCPARMKMRRLLLLSGFPTWPSRASLQQHPFRLSRARRGPIPTPFHAHFLLMANQSRFKT
ncbi:hypothetical protein BC827DRAFT_466082 [Russula dissimulans]|nr:hypothetical protein BC827DRAFT_466082 [Russula dissimulans]